MGVVLDELPDPGQAAERPRPLVAVQPAELAEAKVFVFMHNYTIIINKVEARV
jgi:hypothetical protein